MHWYPVCLLGHTIYRVTVLRPAALMQRPGCEPESLIATQRRPVAKKKKTKNREVPNLWTPAESNNFPLRHLRQFMESPCCSAWCVFGSLCSIWTRTSDRHHVLCPLSHSGLLHSAWERAPAAVAQKTWLAKAPHRAVAPLPYGPHLPCANKKKIPKPHERGRALPPVRWMFNFYCALSGGKRELGNQPNLTNVNHKRWSMTYFHWILAQFLDAID